MPDIITLGETMAMFAPEVIGRLRYSSEYHMRIAGAESNVAIGVVKLGGTAGWISCLGNDEFGHFIRNKIRGEGVDTSCVTMLNQYQTGIMFKERCTMQDSKVYYYRQNSAASRMQVDMIPTTYIADAKILHLTGITPLLSQSCNESINFAIEVAKKNHIQISFDPNIRKKLWTSSQCTSIIRQLTMKSDIVLIGLEEAKFLFALETPKRVADFLLSQGVSYVAIKDGARGAWVASKEEQIRIRPIKCNCIEPIGAGDAFAAAFLMGIMHNKELSVCGKMGAIAGALATQTIGDVEGYPLQEEMEQIFQKEQIVYR